MWILCNNYGKKLAYLKPPESVQLPRASKYGLLCIRVFSSCVFQNRLKEMSLMATPYATYHKLTKVANTYCSVIHRKIAGLYVWKTMLETTRKINEILLFCIQLLRLPPLIV